MWDLAASIDLANVFIRLGMMQANEIIDDLNSQLDIIKYRSHETINEHTEAKYESKRQRQKKLSRA